MGTDAWHDRRSMMFQEVLAIIAASPNPHQWPHSSMQTYWFGHFANADDAVPTLISVRALWTSASRARTH